MDHPVYGSIDGARLVSAAQHASRHGESRTFAVVIGVSGTPLKPILGESGTYKTFLRLGLIGMVVKWKEAVWSR
jgi:hypothetical protein